MQATRRSHLVRLGPFLLDLQAGELHKEGRRLRLQEQPFQILRMLLEHPGEVVTREEIRKRLWPNDTIVEFDHSIGTAIKKLRQALCDEAESPRYVETLPRRGFRLIFPLDVSSDSAEESSAAPPQMISPDKPGDAAREDESAGGPIGIAPGIAAGGQAAGATPEAPADFTPSDLIGRTVSHYRILERLGGGGMGIVYKAEDTRLGRMVALKFLPAELAQERQALARFQREARAASALNHPNICTVYDIDEHAGLPFIAMEFLEGQTLRERIENTKLENRNAKLGSKASFEFRVSNFPSRSSASLPVDEVLDLAMQIAAGLEAAHGKGIVHRDIKPANIFLTTQGQAKILDFGVAKLTRGAGVLPVGGSEPEQGDRAAAGPTRPTDDTLTQPGSPIGTAAYMSPEQVRGEVLDTRTDIFSFGAVLYEMATGRQAFPGGASSAVQQAILTQQPVSSKSLYPDLPPKLDEIINRALEKDRELRYQHASDMRAELQRLKRDTDSGRSAAAISAGNAELSSSAKPGGLAAAEVVSQSGRPRWKVRGVVVGGFVLVVIALLIYFQSRPLPPPKVSGYVPVTHNGIQKDLVGTDGARLYFNEQSFLNPSPWQVSGSGGEEARVPVPSPTMVLLAVSPDGATLLVADELGTAYKGRLWAVPVLGGSPRRLGEAVGGAAAWSPDGQMIVYADGHDLFLAKSDGAEPHRLVSVPDQASHPVWSPDGTVIRFSVGIEQNSLWQVSVKGIGLHRLFPGWHTPPDECCGKWTPDGKYFVFQSKGNIWALAEKGNLLGKTKGQALQLTSGPMTFSSPLPSKDGKKLFVVGELDRGELVRYDAKSAKLVPFLSGISASNAAFSKDGQWVPIPPSRSEQFGSANWTAASDSSSATRRSGPCSLGGRPTASRSFSLAARLPRSVNCIQFRPMAEGRAK